MCKCIFCHSLHNEKLRLSDISESLLSGSSLSILSSSLLSLSDKIHTFLDDDPDSSDSDMLESLSFSVCNLWQKRQLHINTDFVVTGWTLCAIPHIRKDAKYHSDSDHRKQVNNVINKLFY